MHMLVLGSMLEAFGMCGIVGLAFALALLVVLKRMEGD